MKRLPLILILLLCHNAFGALTVVTQELWNDYAVGGLYNSTHIGSFASVTGSLYQEAGGPYVSGESNNSAGGVGQSVDLRLTASGNSYCDLTPSNTTFGIASIGFFLDNVQNETTNVYPLDIGFFTSGSGTTQLAFSFAHNGHVWTDNGSTYTDTGNSFPTGRWAEWQLCFQNTSGNTYSIELQYRLMGSSTWTNVYGPTSTTFGGTFNRLRFGAQSEHGNQDWWQGRMGAITYLTGTSTADFFTPWSSFPSGHILTDITSMPSYYLDQVGGTDTTWTAGGGSGNDGTSSSHAFKTWSFLNTYSNAPDYIIFGGKNNGWDTAAAGVDSGSAYTRSTQGQLWSDWKNGKAIPTGSTITFLSNNQTENRITSPLNIAVNGCVWKSDAFPTGYTWQSGFTVIAPSAWSLSSGLSHTYQAALTHTLCVGYEDRKILKLITGASFSAVKATVDATPGSYYKDASNIYVDPIEQGNPASDGHCYEYTLGSDQLNYVVNVIAGSGVIEGFDIDGTCNDDPTTTGPFNQYGLFVGGSGGGWISDHILLDHISSHATIADPSGNNELFVFSDVVGQRGNPFSNSGGDTEFVDYTAVATTGCGTLYQGCSDGVGIIQQIGSTLGASGQQWWTTHGNTSQTLGINFVNCQFPSCSAGGSNQGTAAYSITNSILGGAPGGQTAGTDIFTNDQFLNVVGTAWAGVFNNAIITFGSNAGSQLNISGVAATFINPTIDWRGGPASQPVFSSSGSNNIVIKGGVMIPGTQELFHGLGSGELTTSYSEWQGTSATDFVNIYTGPDSPNIDLTLSGMQTNGIDTGSVTNSAISVNPYSLPIPYARTAQSAVTHNWGSELDITNTLYAGRQTAGVFEWPANSSGAISQQIISNIGYGVSPLVP